MQIAAAHIGAISQPSSGALAGLLAGWELEDQHRSEPASDPYDDFFREANLAAYVENQVAEQMPRSNDPVQLIAMRQVLQSTNISELLRQHSHDPAPVIEQIVSACRQAAERANSTQDTMLSGIGGAGHLKVRFKVRAVDGGLSGNDLTPEEQQKISNALDEVFEREDETAEAYYVEGRGLWRVDLDYGRYVYIAPRQITRASHSMFNFTGDLLSAFQQTQYTAPIMAAGRLQYKTQQVTDPAAWLGGASQMAMAMMAAIMLEELRKSREEEIEEAERSRSRLAFRDVAAMPDNGFTPTDDLPERSASFALQPSLH